MEINLNQKAAEVLKIDVETAAHNSKRIPEINATYFWKPSRGGCSVIINDDGEKLSATSAVNLDRHIQAFKNGKRN